MYISERRFESRPKSNGIFPLSSDAKEGRSFIRILTKVQLTAWIFSDNKKPSSSIICLQLKTKKLSLSNLLIPCFLKSPKQKTLKSMDKLFLFCFLQSTKSSYWHTHVQFWIDKKVCAENHFDSIIYLWYYHKIGKMSFNLIDTSLEPEMFRVVGGSDSSENSLLSGNPTRSSHFYRNSSEIEILLNLHDVIKR